MTSTSPNPVCTRLLRIQSIATEAFQARIMADAAQTEDAAVALWSLHGEKVDELLGLITSEQGQADLAELVRFAARRQPMPAHLNIVHPGDEA